MKTLVEPISASGRPWLLAFIALGLGPALPGQDASVPPSAPRSLAQAAHIAPAGGIQIAQSSGRSSGPSADTLIARPKYDGVLEGFRQVYRQENAPRFVICVNRGLLEAADGAKKDGAAPALADPVMVTEIERMFGRAFRNAGARITEQKVAIARASTEPGARLTGEAAAKDRQALAAGADIAIEVLISRRQLTVAESSGDITYPVPNIQATAIRLRDAAVVGRASAAELLRKGVEAGRGIRPFDVRDISIATAIALMEDMLAAKP